MLGDGLKAFGTQALALPLMVFLVAVILAWFAHHSGQKGWLE